MKKQKIIIFSMLVVLGSFLLQLLFLIKKKEKKILTFEEQYADYLKSEYEQFEESLYGTYEDEEDDILNLEKDQNQIRNISIKSQNLIDFCSERKLLNYTQNSSINISIYFDWDDQFNSISSLFNFVNESAQRDNIKDQPLQQQYTLTIKLNNNILRLQMAQNFSQQTDIIVSKSSLIKGRFQYISNYLCYNQIFNHIPGSNYLNGKASLINSQLFNTKKYRNNFKCLLEIDFYPKLFDLRNDCSSFEDYINIQHLETDKHVQYISIQGSYNRIYTNFSNNLKKYSNTEGQEDSKIFSCSQFWEEKNNLIDQPLLVEEILFESQKTKIQANQQEVTEQSHQKFFVRVNFLISSTKPLIVYCQNNEFIFMKCKFGTRCNKRIKQSDFFSTFKSLNQEILAKKIFQAITYTILSVKSKLFEDSRVFEIFTADFSIQEKVSIKLEEIHPFTNIYKDQEVGYDSSQKRFLKESLLIVSQQFIDKVSKFNQHSFTLLKNQTQQVDVVGIFKSEDQNHQVYLNTNFIEIIINENLKDKAAYKYVTISCV
ncbi:hypothetical protein ABPG72_002000 [Tetrahymena utriculariae]